MSRSEPKSEADEDKSSFTSIEIEERTEGDFSIQPGWEGAVLEKHDVNNGNLAIPLYGPTRPLSPNALSTLSADDHQQLLHSAQSQDDPAIPSKVLRLPGWRAKLHRFWIRNKGLAFMLVAQVFGVLMNVATRLLEVEGNKGKGMHPAHILFARMSITCILSSGYMWYRETPYFPLGMPEIRWLLVTRGLAGFAGVFGMYYSLLYLPLADATVITFLAPGLACWACSILIKEPFTRVEQIGSLVSLAGVVFISRPTTLFSFANHTDVPSNPADSVPSSNSTASADASSYDNVTPMQRLSAVGIALVGVMGTAVVFTVIRWIGKRAHPLITVNYFAAWCTVVSTIAQIALPGVGWLFPASLKDWAYLFFLGTCGFTMQFLLAAGLAYEKSSRATNMTYTSMLFALFFDKVIFGHTPDTMSIIGSSLILGSAITVALQQDPNRNSEKENVEGSDFDEESRAGLISGVPDSEIIAEQERLPVQEVQLRALR